ncbi:MAG: hypothetical protein U9N39_02695, partial [Campylobacterota bacterium]|nr:hypothetical protein [Campylobacterota bacterium]
SLVELTPKELTILGDTRAENIIGYLVQEKSIDLSRINKITTSSTKESEDALVKVGMEIKVK